MSDLLKMYKTLEDVELGQRVQGAVVKKAHHEAASEGATEQSRAFAALVLSEPFRRWEAFHLEAAANGSVLSSVVLSRDRATAYTHDVPDSDIEWVVGHTWPKIAARNTP